MSWQVDGVYFHSRAEYEAALRKREANQTREEASQLRRQAQALQERVRSREREAESARSALDAQVRVNRALHSDVGALRGAQADLAHAHQRAEAAAAALRSDVSELGRVQQQLGARQAEAEARSERQFARVDKAIRATRAEVAESRAAHERHVAEVRRTFEDVRSEVAAGLSEAEARRADTETRLQGAVAAVDAKVEDDRRERARARTDRLAEAALSIELAEDWLSREEGRAERLAMRDDLVEAREQITTARARHAVGDTAALSLADTAFAKARATSRNASRRQAELEAAREGVLERVAFLKAVLSGEKVERFFAREAAQARALLDRVGSRASQGYQSFARKEIEATLDLTLLARLAEQVLVIASSVEPVSELFDRRRSASGELVENLVRSHGPLAAPPAQRFAVEGDRKSPLIVACDFGGARVDLRVGLDGATAIDSYGHATNGTCASMADQVVSALGRTMQLGTPRVDPVARQTSAATALNEDAPWESVVGRLADVERALP